MKLSPGLFVFALTDFAAVTWWVWMWGLQVDLEAMVTELFANSKFAPRTQEQLKAAVVRAAFLANPTRFRGSEACTLDDDVVSGMVIKYKSQV